MGITRRLFASSIICLLLAGSGLAAEVSSFAISQTSVRLPVITAHLDILDASGQPVSGLGSDNLSATIGGRAVPAAAITPFEESGEGVAYVFLLDLSRSIRPAQFALVRESIQSWVEKMRDQDRMALITFGDDVRLIADFTANKQELKYKLATLVPRDGKTQLHSALARAMEMERRSDEGLPARRVIVVLSDGKDEGSGLAVDDIQHSISRTHMPIYAIGCSSIASGERQKYLDVLHRFARSSGGIFHEADSANLKEIFDSMNNAIRRVFVAKLRCDDCAADGRSYRLEINLSVGGKILSDGQEIALIPGAAVPSARLSRGRGIATGWLGYAAAVVSVIGIAIAILCLVALKRRRKGIAQPSYTPRDIDGRPIQEDARPGGVPVRFTVIEGNLSGETHDLLLADRALIGRKQGCDLVLSDDEVSGNHCELLRVNGRLVIADLDSTNGTSVNGVPVAGRCRLESGDTILVGGTELRVFF